MAQHSLDPQIIKDRIRGLITAVDNINDVTVRHVVESLERNLQTNIKDQPEVMSLVVDETTKFIEDQWKPHLKELVSKKCTECQVFPTGQLRDHHNSFPRHPIGCVVVGFVLILSYRRLFSSITDIIDSFGTAGAARVRDIGILSSHFKLMGIVSKRKLGSELPQRQWEEVLQDHEVEAVVITSENVFHAELAFQALEHGKHALVEYPAACSFEEASKLYELAHKKDRVLHVEYIGNLMESHIRLKRMLQSEILKEGTVQFTGGISRLISVDHKFSGWPSFSGIMRLIKLTELFGEMKVLSASMEYFTEKSTDTEPRITGFKMTSVLEATAHPNSKITWSEDRQPSNKRGSSFKFLFESGKVVDSEPAGWQPVGLFMMDLCQFAHEVIGERREELAENEKWTLHCTKIADEIEKKCKENIKYTAVTTTDSIIVKTNL